MTNAEKDAIWRSLPEGFKRQLRCDYATAKSARSIDLTEVRIETHEKILEMYFGKHNLTATEEEPFLEIKDADTELICRVGKNPILSVKSPIGEPKPKFKVGDKVVTVANGPLYGAGWPGIIEQIDGIWAVVRMFTKDEVVFKADIGHLIPYTEKQEPPLKATAAESLIQMARDEMGIVNNDTPKSGTPDWLAYRMELAKAIAVTYAEKGRFEPKDIAVNAVWVVNGIVNRLKGGLK